MSDWIEVLLGLAMILGGAELLVRGSISLALRLSISPAIIGLTVVAIGTSIPEAVVSFQAARLDLSGMTVGTLLGSNIFNIAAILGLATLVNPLTIDSRMLKKEYPFVFGGTVLVYVMAVDGTISRFAGGVMVLIATVFFVTLAVHVRNLRRREELSESEATIRFGRGLSLPAAVGAATLGLVLLKFGGDFAIAGATDVAVDWGWSHRFIGLTVLAFGTSAPELAVCVVAAYRGQNDLAIGNIVGSCLFNLMLILGGAAIYRPIQLSRQVIGLDFPFLMLATLVPFVIMFLRFRQQKQLRRAEGALLVAIFVVYYSLVLSTQGVE